MAKNGSLSDADLSPIFNGAGPRVQLSNEAAAAWNTLALHRDTVMRVKGTVSAYRTFESQQHFWDLYQAGKGNLAAKPGTSNHGLGKAADVPDATQSSIKRYGKRCNWDKIEAPGEAWHFNYVGGFKRPNPGPDPGNPVLRHGSGGFGQDVLVTKLQERLKIHGLAPGKVDGDFGDNTRDALKQFQREKRLKDDGIVGGETWRHLRHKPEATDAEKDLAKKVFETRKELAEKRGKDPTAVTKPDPIRLDEDTLRTELEGCRAELEKT
jgi:murein L,D-transpeptidase YcbB/YkuD